MIRLFNKDETNFDSNGLGVLDPAIKENVVEEKMNGIYNFDFAYLSSGKHASQLEGDMIIKAPTPDGDQLFRIYKVTKNIGYLEVNCYHIFYDLAGNFIEDTNIVSQSGQAAITHFGTGLQYATRFKFVSNIVRANSARMVRLNAVQALLDSSQDNSFLSRWGGEIKRDNFTVYMNDVRGNDKGFKIRHGKNLTGYEANIDHSSVVTRIMPYGYNGLMLPEKYVDSPLRDKYAFTRIKKIEYTNIKAIDPDATSNDEDAVPLKEAYELLRQAAALEYSVNKVDIPTSNFKVTFKNLADTKEYADFKALEKVEPWDYVTVIADNLDIKSRMISYKYDAITQAYKEVELGNYVPSFSDTNTETNNKLSNINNDLNNINNDLNTVAESANGKNSNYYGSTEPSQPVDGDLWYKKNGDKTQILQYDGKSVPPGWKLVVDDATGEEVRQNVNNAMKEAGEAKKQADDAVNQANQAVADAGFANNTADQAKSDAATAGQQAINALNNINNLSIDGRNLLENSILTRKSAPFVFDGWDITGGVRWISSYKTVSDFSAPYQQYIESVIAHDSTNGEIYFTTNNEIYKKSRFPTDKVITFGVMVNAPIDCKLTVIFDGGAPKSLNIKANTWVSLSSTGTPKYVTYDAKRITFFAQFSGSFKKGMIVKSTGWQIVRGEKIGTWTSAPEDPQANIENLNGQIVLKADNVKVDQVAGRVTSAEGQIKLQADQIAQTVSKTELTTKLNGYATQTWTQGQIKTEADKINLSVSKVQSNLDGLQIGGTNYVRNGNLAFQSNNWRAWGASDGATRAINNAGIDWPANTPGLIKLIKPNKAGQFGYAQDGIAVTPSTTYTVSVLAQAAAGTEIVIQTGDGSGDAYQHQAIKLSGGKERVYFTVTTSKTASKTNVYLGFNEGQIGTVWISRIMMVAGNKSMDWAQNPADYASEVQFSQLQLTVNGIQGTVQDKADKSQVTQLANQITSTINNLGTQNFVYNPSFKNLSLSGWLNTNNWYVSDLNVSGYNGTYGAGVNLTNVGTAGKNSFMYMGSKHIPHTSVGDTFYFSAYIKIYGQTTADSYFFVDFATHNDENGSGRVEYRDSNQVTIANGTDKWLKLSGSFKITKPHKYISLSLYFSAHGVSSAHVMFSRPMLSYVQDAPFSDQGVSASEITQLNNLINLRVQKGDIINQINISPESILIAGQKVHITGLTTIDKAVIKDAMIADVKADKITAGTLNAAHVNVINLNANNITTGTLKGANLSMNLNTGEVVFQHGRIHSTSNNVDVNIDQGYLSVANGNTRVLLKNGGIQFVQPTIFDETTNPYLSISNGGSGLAFSGARIVGRDYVVMANNANSSNVFDSPLGGAESFAGISAGYDGSSWHPTKIGGADRGIILSAGKKLSSAISWVGGSASIRIGSDGSSGWNSNRIELIGEYVHSLPTYVRTASGSANVIVAADGALVRSTSASKYKTDIIRTNIPDYGEKLLELPTATWMDIAETKRYRDDPVTQIKPTRNFGMIAEDLADAGLEMLVVRGADGELEGINYDRIGPALIPVIAKLKNEVETLKQKLEEKTA